MGTSPAYADWLRVVRRHLIRPLCSPQSLDRLLALSAHFPGNCQGALEVHLGAGDGAVDLSLRIEEPGQARRLAEQPLPVHLCRFLARWSEAGGPFSSISCIWLEFDLDRPVGDFPTPLVCVRLPGNVDLDWILDFLLPALRGERLDETQRRLIQRCHGEIPEPGCLLYVFSLLSRPGNPLRMEIFGLDPASALAYLRRVAPYAAPPLAEIAPLFEGIDRPHLSFDLGAEILPRVGLEGSFAPQREPRWVELFERLIARRLCTPAERDAVLTWPGYDTFWTAAADWPLERAGMRGFCVRNLSHVKVVAQPDRAPEAKVYLLVSSLAEVESRRDQSTAGSGGTANSPARRSALST